MSSPPLRQNRPTMGGGASKEQLAVAERKLAAAEQKLADEVAAKNSATQRAKDALKAKEEAETKLAEERKKDATQRANDASKSKEAEQKLAEENKIVKANETYIGTLEKSAAAAKTAEKEARRKNTELSLEKALAENKLLEIAEREDKMAREQLRDLRDKEEIALETGTATGSFLSST